MENQNQSGSNSGNENTGTNQGTGGNEQGAVDAQGNKATEKQPEPLLPGQERTEPGTPSAEQKEFHEKVGYEGQGETSKAKTEGEEENS